MTRPSPIKPAPRRSLFQASVPSRLMVATILCGLLWGAIVWAMG